ncbi:MAG: hypothetical protein LBM00_06140 [Deltaproteobacteria bacterium]|nr:hypothetical protein [Deltaproteobacteria bacterium]
MQKNPHENFFDQIPDDLKEADLFITTKDGTSNIVPVYLNKPKNVCLQAKWLSLWQEDAEGTGMSLIEQAADRRFSETDFRVRDYLLCKVGIGNYVHISQTEASKYLNIAQSNISTSIKKLIELGVILQGPSKGKFKTYQINPALAFAGKLVRGISERKNAIKQGKARIIQFPQQPDHEHRP